MCGTSGPFFVCPISILTSAPFLALHSTGNDLPLAYLPHLVTVNSVLGTPVLIKASFNESLYVFPVPLKSKSTSSLNLYPVILPNSVLPVPLGNYKNVLYKWVAVSLTITHYIN